MTSPAAVPAAQAHAHTEDDDAYCVVIRAWQALAKSHPGFPDGPELAASAIDALSAAGRLRPAPTEVRTEYAVWWRSDDGGICLDRDKLPSREAAEQLGPTKVGQYGITRYTIHRREHRLFADGSTLIGAWQPVKEER